MKIGKKYFTVKESIFNRTVNVFINYTSADIDVWCGSPQVQRTNDSDFAGFSFVLTKDNITEYGIQIKEFDWTLDQQGTLIHEIVHTVIKIWSSNNIPYTYDNQEFLAHSVSNLYVDIAAKIFKLKKPSASDTSNS